MDIWEYTKDAFQILGTLATVWIAWLVYNAQNQRDAHDKELQKPSLNIVNIAGLGWVLMNVGQGPAIHVRFADKHEDWVQAVIGYSIPARAILVIRTEIKHGAAIAASYLDLLGNQYLAYCAGDTTNISEKKDASWDEQLYKFLNTNVKRSDSLELRDLRT